ncbi:MAG TPA: DUF1648 domain-containing protein [Bryobacteraceae bacterium]|nr:DUF1648 domain-containing protein [Bryobacteraceae bacterium]
MLSLLGLAALLGLVAVNWSTLPDELPMHFGINGKPDRYGSRWQLLILPVVGIAIFVGMSLSAGTAEWLGGVAPEKPFDAIMLVWTKTVVMALMCYCVWTIIRVARKQAEGMNIFVMFGMVGIMLLPLLVRALGE